MVEQKRTPDRGDQGGGDKRVSEHEERGADTLAAPSYERCICFFPTIIIVYPNSTLDFESNHQGEHLGFVGLVFTIYLNIYNEFMGR
jgi:hypothetical protein